MKKTTKKWMTGLAAVAVLGGLGAVYYSVSQKIDIVEAAQKKDISKKNNMKKAVALLKSFETGDTSVAEQILTKNYIQHNQNVET
jgi:hypothetical protein